MPHSILARSIIFLAVSMSVCGAVFAQPGEVGAPRPRTLTLEDCVDLAISNNKQIQIQQEELSYAKANVLYALSLFMPQADFTLGYTHKDAVALTDSTPRSRKDGRIFFGYQNQNVAEFKVSESIWNGGANYANLKQAKINIKIQEETLRYTRLNVEYEVKRLFYGLLLAYETRRIARDLVAQAQAHYDETKTMYDQGTASKFDVLQSKTQVAKLIPQLVSADNAIDLIKAELKKEIYIDMKQDIEPDGELKHKEVEVKEDNFLQEAYMKNPQMVLKLLGIDFNKWAIEFAKAGWYPQVNATGNYYFMSNTYKNMFDSRHDNWSVGVTASINLFDGFATKARVDEAKAQYNRARFEKDDVIDQIAVDIKNACLNLKEAKAVIASQEDTIVEAKEALRLSEVRFRNGVGINLDVFDSEVSLAQVEQNLAQGIYDYIMARAQLDMTMGKEFYDGYGQ